ncbi:hypothetical protein DPMN_030085 [Dreissena polymorpha]|uniref:Uncharacterized protein n=1 Tax=Dreissena polymorpha TaxID=45954 RepID=A0A9D4LZQ6_DREPO|nr:hypothetical protein DPMN_030085 [Dreissena polymorpha]
MGNSINKSPTFTLEQRGKWHYKIYFYLETEEGKICGQVGDCGIMTELLNKVGANENIEKVWAYQRPLSKWQMTQFIFFHMFVVFKTRTWWWSIEKNREGINVHRSHIQSDVIDYCRNETSSSSTKIIEEDDGGMNVHDFLNWLLINQELDKEYQYMYSNCKDFARAVFHRVAKTKHML